jgi:hypothetical protein
MAQPNEKKCFKSNQIQISVGERFNDVSITLSYFEIMINEEYDVGC